MSSITCYIGCFIIFYELGVRLNPIYDYDTTYPIMGQLFLQEENKITYYYFPGIVVETNFTSGFPRAIWS